MHKIRLSYDFIVEGEGHATPVDGVHHPLTQLLQTVSQQGSIRAAAAHLGLSYRYVWGELKRWETRLGYPLITWGKGQSARLSDMGFKLMWAERQAQAQLAPQIQALRADIERSFATAFNPDAPVVKLYASHDAAVSLLQQEAPVHGIYMDVRFSGSVDAIRALNEGRCELAGFHVPAGADAKSVVAGTYKPLLKPGFHKVVGFAKRQLGLIVQKGNPLQLQLPPDLVKTRARFALRALGAGTRVSLQHWLAGADLTLADLNPLANDALSHQAVAASIASGDADAGFGIESAAFSHDLDFLPCMEETYFLVCRKSYLDSEAMVALRHYLAGNSWAGAMSRLQGYQPHKIGAVTALSAELPWWSFKG